MGRGAAPRAPSAVPLPRLCPDWQKSQRPWRAPRRNWQDAHGDWQEQPANWQDAHPEWQEGPAAPRAVGCRAGSQPAANGGFPCEGARPVRLEFHHFRAVYRGFPSTSLLCLTGVDFFFCGSLVHCKDIAVQHFH